MLKPADPEFPRELLEIPPRPKVLFVRGTLPGSYEHRITVVGSRRMTSYGRAVVEDLVGMLAKAGLVIVSGLALGVDGACHEQALLHGAPTIAVLGGGIDDDSIAPKTNALLAQRILDAGSSLISEYPPGTKPRPEFFAIRDRVIAGLSPTTLVIEAAEHSGALITASLARDAGREVWVVPGNINAPQSRGTNNLLRIGAHAAIHAQDILDNYGITKPASATNDHPIIACLETPKNLDEIARDTGYSITECAQQLSELEIENRVVRDGENYRRA